MKNYSRILAVAGLAGLMSTTALASVSDVRHMQDRSEVHVTGKVDSVKNEREFTLRDQTGVIGVTIKSNQSVVMKQGDSVTVSGTLDEGLLSTNIDATNVTVNKNVARAVGDAIEVHTGISLEGATAYNINNLPKEGLVKISGTVTDVDSEKKFTVRDATGSIKVDIQSPETASLTKGAKVTVIGYVNSGMISKDIDARKVLVVADASR